MNSREATYHAHQQVIAQGAKSKSMFLILNGLFKVHCNFVESSLQVTTTIEVPSEVKALDALQDEHNDGRVLTKMVPKAIDVITTELPAFIIEDCSSWQISIIWWGWSLLPTSQTIYRHLRICYSGHRRDSQTSTHTSSIRELTHVDLRGLHSLGWRSLEGNYGNLQA